MDIPAAVQKATAALLNSDAKRATVYLGACQVVSICRRHKPRLRSRYADLVVKIGVPNYLEREFIAACKKAGEPLPLRKVQLKPWPKKRS